MEVFVHSQVALYVLNQKREAIAEIEQKFDLKIIILEDDDLIPPDFNINPKAAGKSTKTSPKSNSRNKSKTSENQSGQPKLDEDQENSENSINTKRRRRSRKQTDSKENKIKINEPEGAVETSAKVSDEEKPARRRRGRRGGRGRAKTQEEPMNEIQTLSHTAEKTKSSPATPVGANNQVTEELTSISAVADTTQQNKTDDTVKRRRVRRKKSSPTELKEPHGISTNSEASNVESDSKHRPETKTKIATNSERSGKPKIQTDSTYDSNVTIVGQTKDSKTNNSRGGWWNKITGG
jgi:ribonuclease E